MLRIINILILLLFCLSVQGQAHFEGTYTNNGNKLTFKIKPVGGNITESLTYFDFNIRYATNLNITFSNITPNTTNFPGINIQKAAERTFGGKKYTRFVHNTGTTGMNTYMQDQEYVVFTVTLVDPMNASGNLELASDLASEDNFPNDYIFSVNNAIGLPITDQTAPFNYFYSTQTNPMGTEYVLALNGVALPVVLQSFEAISRVDDILLKWESASEVNFDGYEILRSSGDIDHFEKIGFVDGYNTRSGGEYTFIDSDVKVNTNYYYRLNILDLDGGSEFSQIDLARINKSESKIFLYPNPTSNTLTIQAGNTELTNLKIHNSSGISVQNLITVLQRRDEAMELDLSHLPNGIYFIVTETQVLKVSVLK